MELSLPAPPVHLHKAQTGGDVTNKPDTHSARELFPCFSTKKDTQPNPPGFTINEMELKAATDCIPAGDHSEGKQRPEGGGRAFSALSLGQNSPESKDPPPRFFPFLQDGNVHLKTSLLYRGYIAQLSALLSGRQVPIKPLIYGARCIPSAPARRQFR